MVLSPRGAGAFLAALLTVWFAPCSATCQIPPRIDDELQDLSSRAQTAAGRRDYRAAASTYEKMLRLWPRLPEIEANLGLMDHLLGRYSEAVPHFESALRQKPDLFAANLFLGIDLLRLGHPHRALPYVETAAQLNSGNLEAEITLGRAYADVGQMANANQAYYRAVRANPRNLDALYGLGITYMKLHDGAVEKLANFGRNSFYARLLLAESLRQEGWARDSIRVYRQLLSSHPHVVGLHTALGVDEVEEGQLLPGAAEFETELRANPCYLPARLGLARVDFEKGNTEAGAAILDQLWKSDSRFTLANLGLLWRSSNPRESADLRRRMPIIAERVSDGALRRVLEQVASSPLESNLDLNSGFQAEEVMDSVPHSGRSGTSPESLYAAGRYSDCARELSANGTGTSLARINLLARCSYFSGDFRTSFAAAGHVLRSEPDDPEALYWRAKSAAKLSFQSLMAAGLVDPDSYQVHLLLGEAYLAMNRFTRAEAEDQKALRLKPGNLAALNDLAIAYWRNMNFDRALPFVKDVLTARPWDSQASYIMGEILVQKHEYASAKPYLIAARSGTGNMALYAYALLAKVAESQGQTTEAIADLKKSLPADNDGSLHFQLYRLYRRLGDQQDALSALHQSEAIRKYRLQSAASVAQIPH